MRAESKKAILLLKSVFWIGLGIFNLLLWVPMPFAVDGRVLYSAAAVALLVAIVVPIRGLKKHQVRLELLKVSRQALKRKSVNEAGRSYLDQIKLQDRPLIVAEFEVLQGSKWAEQTGKGWTRSCL